MSSHSTFRDRPEAARLARGALVAAAMALLVGGIVVTVVLLGGRSGSRSAETAAPGASELTPRPVVSPRFDGLALAGHERDVLVGLGVHRGGPLDVVVIPSDESAVRPEDVRVEWRGRVFRGSAATACGSRCLRFPARVLAGSASGVVVDVVRPGKRAVRVSVPLPARMPQRADGLLAQARTHMLRLRALAMDETLGAGLSKPVVSRWSFQAPDRMSYSIAGGAKAIVIGTRRWDDFGRGWQRSETTRLEVPSFPWQNARRAHLLGHARFGGTRVRILSTWLPASGEVAPTWFLLYVRADGRVLRMRMLTTGHFMTDTYRQLGAAQGIRPPK